MLHNYVSNFNGKKLEQILSVCKPLKCGGQNKVDPSWIELRNCHIGNIFSTVAMCTLEYWTHRKFSGRIISKVVSLQISQPKIEAISMFMCNPTHWLFLVPRGLESIPRKFLEYIIPVWSSG